MKKFYINAVSLLSVAALFFSCGKRVENLQLNDSFVETVKMDINDKVIEDRDAIFKNIKWVVLETQDKNLIGQIDDLLFVDNTIVVVDKNIAKGVFLFDSNGKFKTRVSSMGRGNHEYLQLTHVFLQHDTIAINDLVKREINYYDLNGKHLGITKYELLFNEVEYLGNGFIVCNIYQGKNKGYKDLDYYSFAILRNDDELKTEYAFGADNSSPDMIFKRTKNLYSFDDHVYCTVNFENVIYELTKDSAIAKYRLAMIPDLLMDKKFKTTDEAMEYLSSNPFFHGFYTELRDYSLFGISVPKQGVKQFIYNHNTKETHLIPAKSINPLFSFLSTHLFRYGDNTIVTPVNSSMILSLKKTIQFQDADFAFNDVALDTLTNESNPVLFYYEM